MDEGLKKKQTSWCYYGDLANWGMEKDGIFFRIFAVWFMRNGRREMGIERVYNFIKLIEERAFFLIGSFWIYKYLNISANYTPSC